MKISLNNIDIISNPKNKKINNSDFPTYELFTYLNVNYDKWTMTLDKIADLNRRNLSNHQQLKCSKTMKIIYYSVWIPRNHRKIRRKKKKKQYNFQ